MVLLISEGVRERDFRRERAVLISVSSEGEIWMVYSEGEVGKVEGSQSIGEGGREGGQPSGTVFSG